MMHVYRLEISFINYCWTERAKYCYFAGWLCWGRCRINIAKTIGCMFCSAFFSLQLTGIQLIFLIVPLIYLLPFFPQLSGGMYVHIYMYFFLFPVFSTFNSLWNVYDVAFSLHHFSYQFYIVSKPDFWRVSPFLCAALPWKERSCALMLRVWLYLFVLLMRRETHNYMFNQLSDFFSCSE